MKMICAAAGALMLTGCITTAGDAFDTACRSVDAAHEIFLAVHEARPLPARYVTREADIYGRAAAICVGGRTAFAMAELSGLVDELQELVDQVRSR